MFRLLSLLVLLSAGSSQGLGLLRAPSKETGIFTKKLCSRKKATKPNSKYICDRLFSLQKYGILVNPTSIYGILVNPTSIKILGILVNPTAKIYKDIR